MGKHKHKKHSKSKKKKHSSSSSSESSGSSVEWEVKKDKKEPDNKSTWLTEAGDSMNDFLGNVSTAAHASTLTKKQIAQEEERRHTASIARARELNPHLSGTHSSDVLTSSTVPAAAVDVRWLRRAFERAVERSQESGGVESVREILLQRYTSVQVDQMMKQFAPRGGDKNTKSDTFRNPYQEDGEEQSHRRKSRSRSRDRSRHKHHKSDRNHSSRHSPLQKRDPEPVPRQTICTEPQVPEEEKKEVFDDAPSSSISVPQYQQEEKYVTDADINKMAAQLMKAEVMGDRGKVAKLQANLDKLREAKRRGIKIRQKQLVTPCGPTAPPNEETVTRLSRGGVQMPAVLKEKTASKGATRIASHDAEGHRLTYFHGEGDQTTSLEDLVLQERTTTTAQHVRDFHGLISKAGPDVEEGEYADAFVKCKTRLDKAEDRERRFALNDYKRHQKGIENCVRCVEKCAHHLVISRGKHMYLSLPTHESLTPGHCLLTPVDHVSSSVQLDEDAWGELRHFQQQLDLMLHREKVLLDMEDEDDTREPTARTLLMMETVKLRQPTAGSWGHTQFECVPVPLREAPLLKGYFKKALQEAGSEWAQNRKLVELKSRAALSTVVPPGFSYFAVMFADTDCHGFVHIIDKEEAFPDYFGREVLSDLLEVGPELWRKPKEQAFREQSRKVMQFLKWWEPYDDWRQKES